MQELSYTYDSDLTTLETGWQHTKTSAEVELHVDSHVQKIKNSLVAHQEEGFELHVDCHLTPHETTWQHTKTSAEVELHVDSHVPGSTLQKLSYTLILKYKKLKTAWQHTSRS